MDALSEALRAVRMTGAIFLRAEFTAPWTFASPLARQAAPVLAPRTDTIIIYHLLIEGTAWVKVPGVPEIAVEAGEIVVIPHGEAHTFGHGSPKEVFDGAAALRQHIAGKMHTLRHGGGGSVTRFVCGFMGCDRHAERLFLSGLPTTIKVNVRNEPAGAWLENSIQHLVSHGEPGEPGLSILLSKLSEALFIETMRCYIARLPADSTGWLAGARDPVAGAALALMHRSPAEPWTIARLAEQIGSSRSVLAERFIRYLGESPIAYLTRWRMQLAARMLQETRMDILQIGLAVGYESEPSFIRAFKREFEAPPARYRALQATKPSEVRNSEQRS